MKSIVRGNDFVMKVPVAKMVDGEKVAFPLPGCTDVEVRLCNAYRRVSVPYTVSAEEDNVLLCEVAGNLLNEGSYALEVKGKLFDANWRSYEYEQIRIVSNNASGDTELEETDEGEGSVLMDTAVVILPPDKVVEQLVDEVQEAINTINGIVDTAKEAADTADKAAETANEATAAAQEAEAGRVSAEEGRVKAEQARATAEEQRESDCAAAIKEMETAKADILAETKAYTDKVVGDISELLNTINGEEV